MLSEKILQGGAVGCMCTGSVINTLAHVASIWARISIEVC